MVAKINNSITAFYYLNATQAYGIGFMGNAAKYRVANRTLTYNGSIVLEFESIDNPESNVIFQTGDEFSLGSLNPSLGQCADIVFQLDKEPIPLNIQYDVGAHTITGTLSINDHLIDLIEPDEQRGSHGVTVSAKNLKRYSNKLTICAGTTLSDPKEFIRGMRPVLIETFDIYSVTIQTQTKQ